MERDLLVQTGYSLDDVGGALSWSALGAFLHKADPGSALAYELEPELTAWASSFKTNAILADIYDVLAQINANMVAGFSRKRTQKPKRYPRPGDDDKRKLGKNAVSINELDEWFRRKTGEGGGVNG